MRGPECQAFFFRPVGLAVFFRGLVRRGRHGFVGRVLFGFHRQAQVAQFGDSGGRDHDVVGLDVPVNHAELLRVRQRHGHLPDDAERLVGFQAALVF